MSEELHPVLIRWVDSLMLNDGGWMPLDEVDESLVETATTHETVGYLVKESEHAIAIALSRNADEHSEDNDATRIAGVAVIPRCAILSMRQLRVSRVRE